LNDARAEVVHLEDLTAAEVPPVHDPLDEPLHFPVHVGHGRLEQLEHLLRHGLVRIDFLRQPIGRSNDNATLAQILIDEDGMHFKKFEVTFLIKVVFFYKK
jgi:hypothetical protein